MASGAHDDDAEARPDWSALSDVWREHVLPHAVAR